MMDFDRFFKNQFDTKAISDDRLGAFTLELLPRLAGDARFAALVAPLTTAYEGYFGAIGDEATKANIQVALTRGMQRAFDDFKAKASQHEGAVRSRWSDAAPEYLRFYPQGITEYTHATLANVGEKMTRYAKALDDLGTELSPAVGADFLNAGADGKPKGAIVRFREARKAQLDAKAATSTSKTGSHSSRDGLEIQLQIALLAVAQDAAPRPEAERTELARIFPQYILEGRAPKPEETATSPASAVPPVK